MASQVVTSQVRQMMQQERNKRRNAGYRLIDWTLAHGTQLRAEDVHIIAWRAIPQTTTNIFYQVHICGVDGQGQLGFMY